MSFEQWIGNRHGYCDAHEEGERGDEDGGGGSDHVDLGRRVSVGLETFRNIQVSSISVCKSLGLKAWVQSRLTEDARFGSA